MNDTLDYFEKLKNDVETLEKIKIEVENDNANEMRYLVELSTKIETLKMNSYEFVFNFNQNDSMKFIINNIMKKIREIESAAIKMIYVHSKKFNVL